MKATIQFLTTAILLLMAMTTTNAQAPEIEWEQNYGGNNSERAYEIQQTTDGGFITVGYTFSSESGDVSGQNHGSGDIWVVKINASGTIEWEQNYGGSGTDYATSIQQTTDGGYIVAGESYSDDGDVSGNYGENDVWIFKLDATGTIEWEQNYGGSGRDAALSIKQTIDGGYIAVGVTDSDDGDVGGNNGGRDVWVLKLDPTGTIEWEQNYGGSEDEFAIDVQQTTDGGYIIAGYSKSSDGDVGGNNGDNDVWILKLDTTGGLEWEQNYGGSESDVARVVQETTDGGYIIVGNSQSNDGDVGGNNGERDVWILKLDTFGDLEWEQNYGGSENDFGFFIQQTTDGGYIVAGDSSSGDGNVGGNYGENDAWIFKLDAAGVLEWEQNYGGSGNDRAYCIRELTDGGYIVAGESNSNDGDVGGNNGSYDVWVFKLETTLSTAQNIVPIITLYPNPVNDILNLNTKKTIEAVTVYNLTGQKVLAKKPGTPNAQLDLGHFPAGIFLMDVKIDGHTERYKVIKQ